MPVGRVVGSRGTVAVAGGVVGDAATVVFVAGGLVAVAADGLGYCWAKAVS
jgi:hypothetical protein